MLAAGYVGEIWNARQAALKIIRICGGRVALLDRKRSFGIWEVVA